MTTALSWLDGDPAQRQQMVDMLDALGEKTALDEFGFGMIRDAFADALFPATSSQHTRARYLLFIPWMFRAIAADRKLAARASRDPRTAKEVLAEVDKELADALQRGGVGDGAIIGRRSGTALRLLPSSIYWTAMDTLQINTGPESSPTQLLDRAIRAHGTPGRHVEDEDEVDRTSDGFTWNVPAPPDDFLADASQVTFDLTQPEADFLADRFLLTRPVQAGRVLDQSMTAWLIQSRACDTGNADHP